MRAEGLGFDSVWLTEHHSCDDGYTPSPLGIHAAIAARTERMRLGTNLMLLPLADPIRIAKTARRYLLFPEGVLILAWELAIDRLNSASSGGKLLIVLVWWKRVSRFYVVLGQASR